MSGESLHRRGYRSIMHKASLNEAAAAGVLRLAGWAADAREGAKTDRKRAKNHCIFCTLVMPCFLRLIISKHRSSLAY